MKKNDQLITTCKTNQVLAGFLKKDYPLPAGHLPHWESHRDGQSEITYRRLSQRRAPCPECPPFDRHLQSRKKN